MRWTLLVTGFIVVVPLVAWVGYGIQENSKVTADKVTQYANATDLGQLPTGAARAEALRQLEDMINRLPVDERRKWRRDGAWKKWFGEMTEVEKGQFIDATMPSGFKQWLTTFDDLPVDKRKKFIDDLTEHLRETHQLMTDREPGQLTSMYGTNSPPLLSAELDRRTRTIGIKTFYTESSAETKAELAPFLEELQHETEHPKPTPTPTPGP
jgi:hypothetical protein